MALRQKLSKFKIALDFSQKQLLKMLLDYLTTWEKLLGNNRNDRILLNDFYTSMSKFSTFGRMSLTIIRSSGLAAWLRACNLATMPC